MKVKCYKNGNITIQRTEPIDDLYLEEKHITGAIYHNVEDMELLGEQGCAGNYDMYQYFYNAYTDRKYCVLLGKDNELFVQGKIVRFYPEKMTQEDYEELERER